jgi:hypothetical protein
VIAGLIKIARIASVTSVLRKRSMRRGLLEGRSGWQALAVVFLGISLVKRLSGPRVEVLSSQKLRPGQSISVSAVPRHNGPRPERRSSGR